MVCNERKPTTMDQKVINAGMKPDRTGKIAQRIEFAIGMQVMVTLNVATEADLANRSWGTMSHLQIVWS